MSNAHQTGMLFPPPDAPDMERVRELRRIGDATGESRRTKGQPTQCDRIRELLESRNGDWVPLPAILDLRPRIAQYNARIYELRIAGAKEGFYIDTKIETDAAGETHSWYRLRRA